MKSIYKSEAGKSEILSFYDGLISDWPEPFEPRIISTKFGDTFILCSGNGKAQPLVLLHGTDSNSAMWKADVTEYSKKYRVFCIDIIGECGKSSENRPDWKGNNYSDWLSEVFTKLDIKSASIVGCSFGGWIATDFTIKHPEKVNKLILLAPAGITQVRPSTIFWIIITSIFGKWGFQKINEMVYGNLEIDKTALEFALLVKKHFKPRTDVLPIFTDTQLQQIQIPVYFIGGEIDCFYNSQKTSLRLFENIKLVKNEVLPNTGHVLINQTSKITNFLASSL